jgi:hypothetical protein
MTGAWLRITSSNSRWITSFSFLGEVAMIEQWMGLTIGAAALLIAIPLVISHYRREYRRGQLLRNLDHVDWWYRPRGPK